MGTEISSVKDVLQVHCLINASIILSWEFVKGEILLKQVLVSFGFKVSFSALEAQY